MSSADAMAVKIRHSEVMLFFFSTFFNSQLLKKWAPVFKNYVKRTQDHLDCLSAFEEHFLEQESHWAAMVKVGNNHRYHFVVC